LTGDTRAQHEYKYGEIFSGGINARLCVCFNEAPRFRDKSGAIQQRMRFVPFDNPIPESQWDTTLRARLATEASGILNWGLVGLARLIAQRRFTLPTGTRSSTAVINESIRDWMTRCVAARRGACMPWGDILASYTGFCSLYGYMPSSITNLKSALRCEFESEPTLSRAYANASETSVPRRCWTNLTLHPPTSVQTSVTKENDA
jgi:phage/plasmid-associated DNA primase